MTRAAVAAVVYHAGLGALGNLETALLPAQKGPKMVFELEERLAAVGLVVVHAFLCRQQHLAVFERLHVELVARLAGGGAVAAKGEHVHVEARYQVDELRKFTGVPAGDGVHDGNPDARTLEAFGGTQGLGERARFAEVVVRCFQAVERELVLAAPELLHAHADLVGEVERVSHDAPHESALMEQFRQPPEVGVQDGIAAGHVEVRLAADVLAQRFRLVDDFDHLLPRHALEARALALGKDVAVLAALVALVGDMPLERERWGVVACRGGHGLLPWMQTMERSAGQSADRDHVG